MNKVFIKQYSVQRSGSNYLKVLLEKNSTNVHMLIHTFEFKHSNGIHLDDKVKHNSKNKHPGNKEQVSAFKKGDLGIAISLRNPFSWMPSYHLWKHNKGRSLRNLKKEIIVKYAKYWLKKNKAYLEYILDKNYKQFVIVPYQKLITNRGKMLKRIINTFSLNQKFNNIKNVDKIAGPNPLKVSTHDDNYIKEQKYFNHFTDKQMRLVDDIIPTSFFNVCNIPIDKTSSIDYLKKTFKEGF